MASLMFVVGSNFYDPVIQAVETFQHLPNAPHPLATHVALMFGTWGVEAVIPKFHKIPAGRYKNTITREYALILTKDQEVSLKAMALSKVGDWYDILALARAGIYVFTRNPTGFFGDDWAAMDCSESCTELLRFAGIPVLKGTPAADVTPAALEEWILTFHT